MQLQFHKYQGTGNDFIVIDNRQGTVDLTKDQISLLCNRRFGIGADGLMLLENADSYDFRMVYFNADGGESTMCGNGGRCIVAFARTLGLISDQASFVAIDGPHTGVIHEDATVSLQMADVQHIEDKGDHYILDTGSPHYIIQTSDVKHLDIVTAGRVIRTEEAFQPDGINVNFVQVDDGDLFVRTYERGVEDETLSCGTGVTAAAIAASGTETGSFHTRIVTPGGMLEVSFTKPTALAATDVVLKGPAKQVFTGTIEI